MRKGWVLLAVLLPMAVLCVTSFAFLWQPEEVTMQQPLQPNHAFFGDSRVVEREEEMPCWRKKKQKGQWEEK